MNTPDSLIEAAQAVIERWDSPLWKDLPATANYINALRKAVAARPSPDSSLIEELEALKEGVYYVDGLPNVSVSTQYVNRTVEKVIAIFRLHQAAQPSSAGPENGQQREISDNDAQNNAYLVKKMVESGAGFEDLEDCMLAALVAIRPYLRTTEPVPMPEYMAHLGTRVDADGKPIRPVSITDISKQLHAKYHGTPYEQAIDEQKKWYKNVIITALDAAEVPYVD